MATIIKQVEAIPASYPAAPAGLSDDAAALDASMIWQRIESYISQRWTARTAQWFVEGPGEWNPPLSPATINTIELWENASWTTVTPDASPLGGYCLDGCGPYRVTASVGSGDVPASVNEAFRRLAEYMAESTDRHGASHFEIDIDGFKTAYDRSPAWLARALQNSGAADLLRPYRRAA